MTDTYVAQVGGDHYASPDQHWDLMFRHDVEYLPATATAYIVRWDRKGEPVKDIDKAISNLEKQLACVGPGEMALRQPGIEYSLLGEWCDANGLTVSNPAGAEKRLLMELILSYGTQAAFRQALRMLRAMRAREASKPSLDIEGLS